MCHGPRTLAGKMLERTVGKAGLKQGPGVFSYKFFTKVVDHIF